MSNFVNKFKTVFSDIFSYHPKDNYNFTISETPNNNNLNLSSEKDLSQTIFNKLDKNLEFMKIRYNSMINSDIVIREFTLNARNKQFSAFIFYIDGMVDQKLVNDFVLNPLMLKNIANSFDGEQNKIISEINTNNVTIRKVKKFNITDYIDNCLIPQNSVKKETEFSNIISGINSGNCALFVDTINIAFNIDVKGFKQRSIDSPNNEIVIRGPHEAFVENIRTNTSLLRRTVNNENLVIENIEVGNISKTKCAVCYLKNIANNDLVAEVKFRLNNLDIDSLLSSGELEQLIGEETNYGIPVIIATERPDKATKHLFEGRVVIIVNGNPYVLIMPGTFIDFMSSPEDTNLKPVFANFLRVIRGLSLFLTLLLPGIWVGVTNFHQELIPTELLFSIVGSRQNVPFPMIFEILLMEISFELIREAGLRVPSPIGPTIGIVGALVLGQAAVSASIVSPILIIIIAITGIASFAIPDFSFGFHLRISRFLFIALAYMSGFLGLGLGVLIYISTLCNIKSFGIPYMVPYAPLTTKTSSRYLVSPTWKQEQRPDYLNPKKRTSQSHISMKWKYWKS